MLAKGAVVRIHQSVPAIQLRGARGVISKVTREGFEVLPDGQTWAYPLKSWQVTEIEES